MHNKKCGMINTVTVFILIVIMFTLSIGGRECGAKSKRKVRAGSSNEWAGIAAPSNVVATTISSTRIDVSWSDNSNNEDGFFVERKTEVDGIYIQIQVLGTDINNFSDSNSLCPGNTYYYRIMAFMNTGDRSAYSPETGILHSSPISSVSAGDWHSVAVIGPNAPIWSWGYNEFGQLGLGFIPDSYTYNGGEPMPAQVGIDLDWSRVAVGSNHTIGLKANGTVSTWGWNFWGQLGLNDQDDRLIPTMITSDYWENSFDAVQEVTCGEVSTYALKTDGTLWSWGSNEFGQLGAGDTLDSFAPYQSGTDSDWLTVVAGGFHLLARKSNPAGGTLWSCGDNTFGQLGLGDLYDRLTPTQIGTQSDWAVIAAMGWNSMGRKTDGSLWSWGNNSYGQLGIGGTVFIPCKLTPTQIGTSTDWSNIACGFTHSIAVKTNGTLWTWGSASLGALGLGIYSPDRRTPSMVGTDTDWDKITAGYEFTIASKLNGTIWSCGWNAVGELGWVENYFDDWYYYSYLSKRNFTRIYIGVPNAPSSLSATGISASQINLSWIDNSSDELAFRIERKNYYFDKYTEIGIVNADINSYNDTTANPNLTYYYRVRAHNVYGNGPYSWEISATSAQVLPQSPSILTATAITATRVDLAWDDVQYESGYRIERSTPSTDTYSEIALVNADITSYSDTSLDPLTKYYYRVRAYNFIGNSDYSPELMVDTPLGPPNIPGVCNVTAISATYVNLSWGNVRLEDGYKVERRLGIGGDYSIITTTTVADITIYSDNTVSPATNYYYRVNAYNNEGDSGYTNERSVTTLDVPPNPPTVLTATAITSTQISLVWNDNSSNEVGFRIERSVSGSAFSLFRSVNANIISYLDTTLDPLTEYSYKVKAYNSAGDSIYSPIAVTTTLAGPPNSPSILTATAISQTLINLGWSNVGSEDGYLIERKTNSDGTYMQIGTQSADILTFSDTSVIAATRYYYRVRSYNTYGNSLYYSPEAYAKTWSNPNVSMFGAGAYHSLMVTNQGVIKTCGRNNFGQLGLGDILDRTTPTAVGYTSDWSVISVKSTHTIGQKTNGSLWAWGRNDYGQLGINSRIDQNSPVQINISNDVSLISAGGHMTIVRKSDGSLFGWGRNDAGQLGLGYTTSSTSEPYGVLLPTQIGNNTDWSPQGGLTCGYQFVLAKKNDGTLWSWGLNNGGQLGLGTTINQFSPVQINSSIDWSLISAGDKHALCIKNNGTLWAWGANSGGSLGLGDYTQRKTPTQVGTSFNWILATGGSVNGFGLKNDGTLWAWGANAYGQFGNGYQSTQSVPTPTKMGVETDWDYFVTGNSGFNIASKLNGTIWAWGWNLYGQLGVGDTVNKYVPTLVEE
jgi:alpha-tubulin suppressor-like RCC1 family protein